MWNTLKIIMGLAAGIAVMALMAKPPVSDSTEETVVDEGAEPRGEVFGSVLSRAMDLKEGDLRSAAEQSGETPEALRKFSAAMDERMNQVWKDPAVHEPAFVELLDCVRDRRLASPIRALCAAHAKRLALNDPQKFQERFDQLEKTVDPEIREFLGQVRHAR